MRQIELAAFFKGQLQKYKKEVLKVGCLSENHRIKAGLIVQFLIFNLQFSGKAVHFVNGAADRCWEMVRAADYELINPKMKKG